MTDPVAAHKAAVKKAKTNLIAAEEKCLAELERTNPSYFDTELKLVIVKLLYSNIYEKNNPF